MDIINQTSNTETAQALNHPKPARPNDAFRDACREFEGLLIGMIMKQSLQTSFSDDEEEESGSTAALHEFALEQAARAIGQSETLGISKMLSQGINQAIESTESPSPIQDGAEK